MKNKFIDYITLSFINHIDNILENKDTQYLNKKGLTNISNKDELLKCKNILTTTIKLSDQISQLNIIEIWTKKVGVDYNNYDLVPFSKIFTKRILNLFHNTQESKEALTQELLSFNFETQQLNLRITIENENITRELLRQIALEYDENYWELILEQSKTIQSALIQYFETILKNTSEELKVLNVSLEEKVEEKNRELIYNLYTDKLTNIDNINSFLKDLECLENKKIVLFNIDGFRKINSIYGYSFADEVLKSTTKKVNDHVLTCGNYKLYRYHGDRFIILETKKNVNNIEFIYDSLLKTFSKEDIEVDGEKLSISFTAGIARSFEEPIKYAELAYQMAKENKTQYEVYNGNVSIIEEYKKHQHLLQTIRNAIKNDLVFPYFQLIRDNQDNTQKKYEALMRIEDPMGDVLSPFIFLDVAKDAKLYSSLAKIMMRKSIQTFQNVDASFSINLEVEDVLDKSMMEYLFNLIQEYNVQDKIILEITESEDIKDFEKVLEIFKSFKDIGVKIAIDDFGTGYSNFSYLMKFDFDFIKIDGSLIKNIHTDKESYIITELIVNFAKKLGKKVIAEFIDKPEVQEVIEELGIEYSQGYLFSKPARELI
ncbi:MAG: diguanylate cyclase (GGDEF)-like protein [Sulfurimonas sp.]|jgi:diguanylate cyclase (GGDEF)-like protein